MRTERFAGHTSKDRGAVVDLLSGIRDRVLDGAQLRSGDHVVDVGAGNGLLTLGAAPRVAPGGVVTAVDMSSAALRDIVVPAGSAISRVVGDAHRLPLASGSADAVVTRSVLIYMGDLGLAIREAVRVLRPGGSLSIFEPINSRRRHDARLEGFSVAELSAIDGLAERATPAARTMTAFDEWWVQALIVGHGLTINTYDIDVVTEVLGDAGAVEGSLNRRPHAGAPSTLDRITDTFGTDTADRYLRAWLDSLRTQGPITFTTPVLYLSATVAGPC